MSDDISDPSYPDDIREIQRKAFCMMTGYYCGYAFRADDVRPLMDEIVRLRQIYDLSLFDRSRLEDEAGELFGLVRRLAAGIGADTDGTGYRAKHTVDVVQEVFETIARLTGKPEPEETG